IRRIHRPTARPRIPGQGSNLRTDLDRSRPSRERWRSTPKPGYRDDDDSRSGRTVGVQRRGSVVALAAAPPEPIAVDLVIGAPQNGNARVVQLLQVAGDYVHLRAPALIESSAGRE